MVQTSEVTSKKERLTLSQLARYDDILTDALVDHVRFFKFACCKHRILLTLGYRFISGLPFVKIDQNITSLVEYPRMK